MNPDQIEIYTDGSCNPQLLIGGWAAVILNGPEKVVLQGKQLNTSHNRMELIAVIESLKYLKIKNLNINKIKIYSDSQYVIGIERRIKTLIKNDFKTNKGNEIRNIDLVKTLIEFIETTNIEFNKVKAHLKKTETINYNREVDKLCRGIVKSAVAELSDKT